MCELGGGKDLDSRPVTCTWFEFGSSRVKTGIPIVIGAAWGRTCFPPWHIAMGQNGGNLIDRSKGTEWTTRGGQPTRVLESDRATHLRSDHPLLCVSGMTDIDKHRECIVCVANLTQDNDGCPHI